MKTMIRIVLATAALTVMLAAGCKANTPQNQAAGGQPGNRPQGGMMQPTDGSVMGVITEVSATSVTIAQMPAGQMGRANGQNPDGTPPADGDRQKPEGTALPEGGRGGAMDTSDWEKSTWAIDGSTKIIVVQQDGTEKTLDVSDLKVGDSVSILANESSKTTAVTITVRTGMSGMPGGPGNRADATKAP